MQLVNEFSVPASPTEAWKVLSDVERVVTCIPGAQLEAQEGDDFLGSVGLRVGPVALALKGRASIVERDPQSRSMTIKARATAGGGQGTVECDISLSVAGSDTSSAVKVVTDLELAGKLAQFSTAMISQVNRQIMRQFTSRLDRLIREDGIATTTPYAPTRWPESPFRTPDAARVKHAGAFLAAALGGAMLGWALRGMRSTRASAAKGGPVPHRQNSF